MWRRASNSVETRRSEMAPKLSGSGVMNTNVVLRLRHALVKKDSARRIDRVIDFFGENPPARRPRLNGGQRQGMKHVIRTIAALGLTVVAMTAVRAKHATGIRGYVPSQDS